MKLNKKGDKMRACHDDPEIKSNILAQLNVTEMPICTELDGHFCILS